MPAPTLVQMKESGGMSSGSAMAVFSAAPTVGNSVILIIGGSSNLSISAISAPMGTLTLLMTVNPTGSGSKIFVYYCADVTTASANVTATFSGSTAYPVAYEWPGQINTATNKGSNSGPNPGASFTFTPDAVNEVMYALFSGSSAGTSEPASPWTSIGTATQYFGKSQTGDIAYAVSTSLSSVTPTWSGGTGSDWYVQAATFQLEPPSTALYEVINVKPPFQAVNRSANY